MAEPFRCGYIALVGRPNVGKSTLLNRILGQKLSITSRRPQTTRHSILGIKTLAHAQLVYVDTPGIHDYAGRAINRYMNRAAGTVLQDVDVVVFIVEALRWLPDDELVLKKVAGLDCPVLLAINKIDTLASRELLLPELEKLSSRHDFAEIIPISASKGTNVAALESAIEARLPQAPPYFPEDQITDRSERFLVAELIREKLFRKLARELPYGLTVEVEAFRREPRITHIHALIWVERQGQKNIVIGRQGTLLKEVGQQARRDIEALIGGKVNLQLWVKVKEGWVDDERALRSLGYTQDD
jgi:GTP-binding protein Era